MALGLSPYRSQAQWSSGRLGVQHRSARWLASLGIGVALPTRPPTYRPKGARTRRQTNAEYDARRGSARARGYGTAWDKASAGYKRRHPLCLGCEAIDRIVPTEVTDHVIPHKGDQKLFWDRDNWQPACRWHHDEVKQRLEALFDQGKVGPEALRLDSEKAKEISLFLDPRGGV